MISLPTGFTGVVLAENLGILGAASLMHPKGLQEYLPLVEPFGMVPAREALADVYRVAKPVETVLRTGNPGLNKLGRTLYKIGERPSIDTAQAVDFLKKLADGFSDLPTAEHGRVAHKLLADHPEWITSQMRETDPMIQAAFRFRDAELGGEIEQDTRLLNVGVPVSFFGTIAGGGGGIAGAVMMDATPLFLGGITMVWACLGSLLYMLFVVRPRELDNRRLWRELQGAEYPRKSPMSGVHMALT